MFWCCVWGWRTRRGAALPRHTTNDCDPGSCKNKDYFSILPLLAHEWWRRGKSSSIVVLIYIRGQGGALHQEPQRIRYSAVAGWTSGGKPCENKVPPKVLALILHCTNVSRITDANYTQKQSFWVLTLKKRKENGEWWSISWKWATF